MDFYNEYNNEIEKDFYDQYDNNNNNNIISNNNINNNIINSNNNNFQLSIKESTIKKVNMTDNSNSTKKNEILLDNKNYIYCCKNCYTFPLIKIINGNLIEILCLDEDNEKKNIRYNV